jgi:hypothetical protein
LSRQNQKGRARLWNGVNLKSHQNYRNQLTHHHLLRKLNPNLSLRKKPKENQLAEFLMAHRKSNNLKFKLQNQSRGKIARLRMSKWRRNLSKWSRNLLKRKTRTTLLICPCWLSAKWLKPSSNQIISLMRCPGNIKRMNLKSQNWQITK